MAILSVYNLPDWVDPKRLLDDGPWERSEGAWIGERPLPVATLIGERLRNQGLGGKKLEVRIHPSPRRSAVRKARTEIARLRRGGESGFKNSATRVDEEGRAFLTSERLAMSLARRVRGSTVIDATCGCGGNAIAFARMGLTVTAIDTSAHRLKLARHNARVYDVEKNLRFLHGDARKLLPGLRADLLFIDPPWGESIDRVWCRSIPLLDELLAVSGHFTQVWAKVPPSYAPAPEGFRPEAWFGMGKGDRQVVKFVLLRRV